MAYSKKKYNEIQHLRKNQSLKDACVGTEKKAKKTIFGYNGEW